MKTFSQFWGFPLWSIERKNFYLLQFILLQFILRHETNILKILSTVSDYFSIISFNNLAESFWFSIRIKANWTQSYIYFIFLNIKGNKDH